MRLIYKVCQKFIRSIAYFVYNAEIRGVDNIDSNQNNIIASNHVALTDPPFIGSFLSKEINFLAKSELFNNPLFGFIIRKFNAIPIRRGIFDKKALSIAANKLKAGQTILIFPEGSRSSNKVKPGIGKIAYETQTDIIPVYIENSEKLFSCLFRKKKLKIFYGKPIKINKYLNLTIEKKDLYKLIASDVKNEIYSLNDKKNVR